MHRNRKGSDFAHNGLGFVTQKARENTSRWRHVNSNEGFISGDAVDSNDDPWSGRVFLRIFCLWNETWQYK